MVGVRVGAALAVMAVLTSVSPVQAHTEQRVTARAPSRQEDTRADARRAVRQWIALQRTRGDRPETSARAALSPVSGACDQPTVTDPRGDNGASTSSRRR